MKNHTPFLFAVIMMTGLFISGCSNLEITKRRHLPGYHVELGSKNKDPRPAEETAKATRSETAAPMIQAEDDIAIPTAYEKSAPEMDGHLTAATTKGIAPITPPVRPFKSLASLTKELVVQPFRDLKRDKAGSELRRAVFPEEGDEKYGWSVVGIIAMALSIIAFIALLIGIVSLASGVGFWFVPLIFGFVFGLVGMILGIVGMRQTGSGGRRGRAFALVGMILGIVSFAGSIIALVAGLVINFLRDSEAFD